MDNLSLERLFLQNISETNQIFTTDIWELATSICENKKNTNLHMFEHPGIFPSLMDWISSNNF